MLELITLPGAFGMRNVSPFCLKAEMLLTALDVPFKMTEQGDPRKTPKGKLPYMVADGRVIADSELIVEFLDEYTQGRVYAGLTAKQKGEGLALVRLAEEHLYWLMVSARWLDDTWFPHVVEGFFGIAPKLVRGFVARQARKEVQKTYHLQGLGRHSAAEQRGFAERDLDALDGAVPQAGFLHGDTPNVFDFAIASIMAGLVDNQPPTWVTPLARERTNLMAYTERVQEAVGVYGRLSAT